MGLIRNKSLINTIYTKGERLGVKRKRKYFRQKKKKTCVKATY